MEHRHSSQPSAARNSETTARASTPAPAPRHDGAAGSDDEHLVHSHGQHAGHSVAMFKNRFWLTLALAVPVVFFSPMFAHLLGYRLPLSRLRLDPAGAGHGHLLLRRPAVPQGRPE